MCRPNKTPPTGITVDSSVQSQDHDPRSKKSTWPTKLAIFVALTSFGFTFMVSEIIGGWTKQYTSPVMIPTFGKLNIPSQEGKVVIVTGANTGIGYETSLALAKAGAHVIVACRSETKASAAIKRIQQTIHRQNNASEAQLTFLPLDLSSLRSVQQFVGRFHQLQLPLDTLILNAGVMKSPGAEFVAQELTYGFETTQDGLEYHIGVNHIAHFYLAKLLIEQNLLVDGGRIVAVSSMAEQGSYESGFMFEDWLPVNGNIPASYEDGKAYGQSKLANLLFVRELLQRYPQKNLIAYSCHPGVIQTDLSRYMEPVLKEGMKAKPWLERTVSTILGNWFQTTMMGSSAGALTQLYLATTPSESLENGAFYHPVGRPVTPTHPQGSNRTLQSLLWDETERIIQRLA